MAYEEQQKKKMQRAISLENADFDDPCPRYLPQEIFLENILTRLQARDVARYSCVCKLWNNYTFKDSKFASSHFIQNKNKLNLVFNLSNVSQKAYFFTLEKDEFDDTAIPPPTSKKRKRDDDDDEKFLSYRILGDFTFLFPCELVGYCNGLACFKPVSRDSNVNGAISILHPIMAESLVLSYLTPTQSTGRLCNYLCHGFGFDSLSEEYKVVIIFTTTPSVKTINHQEFVCMVVTLGGR
ncbi:F-box protein At3g07870-like [Papaver somniferum]|uniref:F-box protein At3g07870-like n=1 Tax=Papaver somniferum TaxID=3469 RepID=UPI000E6FA2F6|nr:F-box protein At3g07870-like [Papaver somniferum]